ncbi:MULTISPECIES: flippase [unclassified Pseudoalteromonas]|uniref:flippase n=1 Tax=unclassified Pseudoalteromonas TaxID=194690 RepID=UPI0023B86CCC|nr:flippase [Pseudoalteromonas sp. CnMc7-15]
MSHFSALKNSLTLIFDRFFLMALTFTSNVVIARIGGVELFGQYSMLLAYVTLFSPLCIFGLNNIATHAFLKYPARSHLYMRAAIRIRLFGALLSVLIGTVLSLFLFPEYSLIVIALLAAQAFTCAYVIEFYFIAKEQAKVPARTRLVVLSLLSAVKIAAVFIFADVWLLLAITAVEFVAVASVFYWLYAKERKEHRLVPRDRKVPKKLYVVFLSRSKWLLLSGLAAIIYLKIDQVMLGLMGDETSVALYAAAIKLSEFWFVLPVLAVNGLSSLIFRAKKRGEEHFNQLLQRILGLFFVLSVAIVLITVISSDLLIELLFGEQFALSASILQIHIISVFFVFIRAVFSKWLIYKNLLAFSLASHLLGAVTNVLLNLYLIPHYGALGAAWATVLAYAVSGYFALWFFSDTRPFAKLAFVSLIGAPSSLKMVIKKKHFND